MDPVKELQDNPAKGALTFLGLLLTVVVIPAVKAWRDKSARERKMQSVPPSHPTPEPTIVHLLTELDREKQRAALSDWRAEEWEGFFRKIEHDHVRTSEALADERKAHEATREQLAHYRGYCRELEDRARALDSGFTALGPAFGIPKRVVEEDATPTVPPARKR